MDCPLCGGQPPAQEGGAVLGKALRCKVITTLMHPQFAQALEAGLSGACLYHLLLCYRLGSSLATAAITNREVSVTMYHGVPGAKTALATLIQQAVTRTDDPRLQWHLDGLLIGPQDTSRRSARTHRRSARRPRKSLPPRN